MVLKPDLKGSSVVKRDPLAEEFKYDSQDYCPALPTDDYDDHDDDHDACGKCNVFVLVCDPLSSSFGQTVLILLYFKNV